MIFLPISGEPNVTIMEAKALTCNIVPGRLPRGPAFAEFLNKYAPQAGPVILHPEERRSRDKAAGPRDRRKRMRMQEAGARPARRNGKELNARDPSNGAMIGEGTHSTNQRRHTLRARQRRGWLLHRSDCVHRLQSVRSRVQRMEPGAR